MFVRFEFHGLFFVSTRHFGWTPRWLLTYLLTYLLISRGLEASVTSRFTSHARRSSRKLGAVAWKLLRHGFVGESIVDLRRSAPTATGGMGVRWGGRHVIVT